MKDNTLTRLIARLRPERPRLAIIFPLIVLSIGFSIIGPLLLGDAINVLFDGIISRSLPAGVTKIQLIDELRASGAGHIADMIAAMNINPGTGVNVTRLGELLGLTALIYLLTAVTDWAQAYLMAGVSQRTLFRLRQEAAEKLARLPLRYFDSRPHGEILSLFTNDIDNLASAIETGLSKLLTSALMVLAILGVMFWISPLLAALTIVTVPLSVVTTRPIVRRIRAHAEAQWNQTGELNGLVEQTHTGHDLIAVYGQRQPVIDEFNSRNERLREASFRTGFLSGLVKPVMSVIGNLNYVLLAVIGGFQVATGAITLGSVQALITYSRRFSSPVQDIAAEMAALQSGLASARRVFDFLDVPEDRPDLVLSAAATMATAVALPHAARRVQLQRVSFRYDPHRPLIEDLTLEAAPGQTVAIVGPTGAGKTTLVNLLMRFYEINGGRILLDGVDYSDLSRDEVRRCYGMVLQDTWLFAGTIWDNIGYGRHDASDEEILAASRAAYVDHFVRTLPDGYATVLDSEASSLSTGQKQLLTVARAFLANPDILILDEATSNVDTRTEILIQNAMARLRSGRTSFVIAHRLSTIRAADTIVVMDAGRIVEQGKHDELLRNQGFYHRLYSSQFAETLTP
ncbi:MAG: ABC transporter ATP-binding protein [Streptosporangiaceae bacterium]|nr:ABC transporter ATP-binding protein [Streptosporangiaceae bacterium]